MKLKNKLFLSFSFLGCALLACSFSFTSSLKNISNESVDIANKVISARKLDANSYTITNNCPESQLAFLHGYLEVPSNANEGETVTVVTHPNADCVIVSLSYNDGSSDYNIPLEDEKSNYDFVMPSHNVEVNATFKFEEKVDVEDVLKKSKDPFPVKRSGAWIGDNRGDCYIDTTSSRILTFIAGDLGDLYTVPCSFKANEAVHGYKYISIFNTTIDIIYFDIDENDVLTAIRFTSNDSSSKFIGTYEPDPNARKTISYILDSDYSSFPTTEDGSVPTFPWKNAQKGAICYRYKNDGLGKDELIFKNDTEKLVVSCLEKVDPYEDGFLYQKDTTRIYFEFSLDLLTKINYLGDFDFAGDFLSQHTHIYGDVTASWNNDQCTLVASCSCGDTKTRTYTGTYQKVSDATYTQKEKGKYVLVVAEGSFFDGTYESEVFEVGEVLPQPSSNNGLSGGAIAGIIIGSIAAAGLITGLIVFLIKRKNK